MTSTQSVSGTSTLGTAWPRVFLVAGLALGAACWGDDPAPAKDTAVPDETDLGDAVIDTAVPDLGDAVTDTAEPGPPGPYGPPVEGACPDYEQQGASHPQTLLSGITADAAYCAPVCAGLAKTCPKVADTSAEGTCLITAGDEFYCAAWCFIDPSEAPTSGPQCPQGATCVAFGPNDGEGRERGLCVYPE